MHAASSQLVLTTGVATHPFDVITSSSTHVPARGSSRVPTLAQYAATWLKSLEGLVRPSTVKAYTRRLEQHVLPKLGPLRLDEVGVDEILSMIGDLRQDGYAETTIATIMIPLSRMFGHAVRRDAIKVNPISKLDRSERPRVRSRERPVLSRQEIRRLLDAADPRYRTLLATAILSGLRQGELLGLHWRNIDFDKELIHVRTALDRRRRDVPPKTPFAVRDVVLTPALAHALQEHRKQSRFDGLDDYVFTTKAGAPMHYAHLGSGVLDPALKKAGIPHIRWHDLRHTFASLLISGGANITFVSRQLGHSSSHITLSVYAHLLDRDEQTRRTREMLQEMLGGVV